MTASHLSLEQAKWDPRSEADLARALQDDLLEETHHLEMKSSVPTGASANKELARDLAQFAIDGGVILVGVAESGGSLALSPVQLSGLCERIEQIAQTRIEPPLFVSCKEITSASDPDTGYILVRVPPSPLAPHMVDGKYPARGDKSRRYLSDSEVARHHQMRRRTTDLASALLEDYIARDPVPANLRKSARIFIVAVPTNPRREMLLPLMDGGSTPAILTGLISSAAIVPDAPEATRCIPRLTWATSLSHRADGVAMANGLNDDRSPQGHDLERIVEIEFGEDATLRMLTTRLSGEDENGEQRILETMLPEFVRQAANLAAGVATAVGYAGMWDLGVAAIGLAGLRIWRGPAYSTTPAYPADRNEYRETTSAHTAELSQDAGAVTARLVGRYLRTLHLAIDAQARPFIS
jgi:hypothetical protein